MLFRAEISNLPYLNDRTVAKTVLEIERDALLFYSCSEDEPGPILLFDLVRFKIEFNSNKYIDISGYIEHPNSKWSSKTPVKIKLYKLYK